MSDDDDATNREMQLRLEEEDDLRLVETASAWCASRGILMGAKAINKEGNNDNKALLLEPAPITLRPTPFSKQAYEQALAMGLPFQHVVHAIASSFYNNSDDTNNDNAVNTTGQEGGWLSQAIQTAAMGDKEFTGRLVQLAQEVAANPHDRAQTVTLGILRSDYMMHSPEDNDSAAPAPAGAAASSSSPVSLDRVQTAIPLQVELNTIASSFGCLSTKISKLHQVLNNNNNQTISPDRLPDNHVTDGLASALAAAIQEYTRQKATQQQQTSNPTTPIVVVMVVQPGEANSIDQ
eukprot:scaffold73459_cov28-Attheya_sp.AAC.1